MGISIGYLEYALPDWITSLYGFVNDNSDLKPNPNGEISDRFEKVMLWPSWSNLCVKREGVGTSVKRAYRDWTYL